VDELGEGVTDVAVGDRVVGFAEGGAYAELAVLSTYAALPDALDATVAVSLPVAGETSRRVLRLLDVRPGETLLVHGGGSGIGTMAIQLAKAVGARVAVTTGSKEKLDRCAELGADILINYNEQDFVEAVRTETEGHGADVILDIIGAKYLDRNIKALAFNGRLAIIGLQGGRKGELNLGALLAKRAAVTATSLRARPAAEKAAIVAAVREHVWPLLADGRVRPVIDSTLPMSRTADAHRAMEESSHVGKIVLTTA
jgi:putative PIG3 family NAD(P)H quinone oxidoreductase